MVNWDQTYSIRLTQHSVFSAGIVPPFFVPFPPFSTKGGWAPQKGGHCPPFEEKRGSRQHFDTDRVFLRYRYGKYQNTNQYRLNNTDSVYNSTIFPTTQHNNTQQPKWTTATLPSSGFPSLPVSRAAVPTTHALPLPMVPCKAPMWDVQLIILQLTKTTMISTPTMGMSLMIGTPTT